MSGPTSWVWGPHTVLEALRSGRAVDIAIASRRKNSRLVAEIVSQARASGLPVLEWNLQDLQREAGSEHTQGIAAHVLSPATISLINLLDSVRQLSEPAFLLALDQIQDPHNLGALIRTADAAGVTGVILPERRSAPITGTVAKVSAGAVDHVQIAAVGNLARSLEELRAAGIWTVGLAEDVTESFYEIDLTVPLTLVIGGEGGGLRRLTREHCDYVVSLPMLGRVESLNASVAGSIAMYEVVRQRSASGRSTAVR